MLLLSHKTIQASDRIFDQVEAGTIPTAEGLQSILELIPDDFGALVTLGKLRREAGDYEGAEEYGWKALRAHPCMAPSYMELALTLAEFRGKKALAEGLSEIGMKMAESGEEDDGENEWDEAGLSTQESRNLRELSQKAKQRLRSMGLRTQAGPEAVEVAEQLRPYRLLRDVWVLGDVPVEKVDEILAEGAAMVPLLVGVMRGWGRDLLGDNGDLAAESALGLLGEMGGVGELPVALEFCGVNNGSISGAARWAVGRIVERQRGEAAKYFAKAIPELNLSSRMSVCEQLARFPEMDPDGAILRQLCEGLKAWPEEERELYAIGVVTALVVRGGRGRLKDAGEMLRRMDPQLPATGRERSRMLLDALTASAAEIDAERPAPVSVYDICGGWRSGRTRRRSLRMRILRAGNLTTRNLRTNLNR